MSDEAGVREPDEERGHYFTDIKVLPEAPGLRHVEVRLLCLPQVQQGEIPYIQYSRKHLREETFANFLPHTTYCTCTCTYWCVG